MKGYRGLERGSTLTETIVATILTSIIGTIFVSIL